MSAGSDDADARAVHAVKEFGDDLYRYAFRRVASAHDADDVISAVFLAIWEQRTRLPPIGQDLRMWCYGIARNKVREHARSVRRRATVVLGDSVPFASADTDPAAIAVRDEEHERVRSALRGLDERSRELVMLIHWDGLSIAEASDLLGMNQSTARTRYARARARLSSSLVSNPDYATPT